jgi:hypothetical protein
MKYEIYAMEKKRRKSMGKGKKSDESSADTPAMTFRPKRSKARLHTERPLPVGSSLDDQISQGVQIEKGQELDWELEVIRPLLERKLTVEDYGRINLGMMTKRQRAALGFHEGCPYLAARGGTTEMTPEMRAKCPGLRKQGLVEGEGVGLSEAGECPFKSKQDEGRGVGLSDPESCSYKSKQVEGRGLGLAAHLRVPTCQSKTNK